MSAVIQNLDLEESPRLDFFGLEIEEAEEKIGNLADKKFHGKSFVSYIYKHNKSSIEEMLSISKKTRDFLAPLVDLSPLPIKKRSNSVDGTVKFLFEVQTPKGPQEIEAVYIPDPERVTLCVSSQVGCKMACQFCLTGQLGYTVNLTASQIVKQIWTVEQQADLRPLTNLVFMGMGEPFDNIENVRKATRILTHHRGFDKSARKITVSTVGKVDVLDTITKEDPFRLAVSLNASENETRSKIMPINRRWKIEELLAACKRYVDRTNRHITFEYILMKGVSDSMEDAKRLHKLMAPLKAKINLIPYNESPFTEFKRPSDEQISRFHRYLEEKGNPVFIRRQRGHDIFAACGMLKKVTPDSL